MTTERQDQIKKLVITAYEAVGTTYACEVANEIKETTYEYCRMCDCQMPVIKGDHECLICGQETTKKDPYEEDIPLENKET